MASSGQTDAIVIRAYGGPEALQLESVPLGTPGPGQIQIRQHAAGVNFHDVYVRSGLYQTLTPPGIPGLEGAGVVEAVGEGVTDFAVGDRVAYMDNSYGGYARNRVLDAHLAVPVPDAVGFDTAAAWLLRGLTAMVLAEDVHKLEADMHVLVHAAGGGVGQLLARIASRRGCTVYGTAGSEKKQRLAREAGCDEVIPYREADVSARIADLTGGKGVAVAYDAVGADTFEGSLGALGLRGHLVLYGQASGPVPPFQLQRLGAKSNSVTRPFLWAYLDGTKRLRDLSAQLFAMIAAGDLPVGIGGHFPLADAAAAHRALEAREAGPFVLNC
ncbi:quinone oxidoreductase [Novosphingobium sp. ZN18A2]|uniref:quinone oxidoreductase family protein n=1 Tax=Novosphingobium sp. ZN18A2 TaxID=3079861 RepID=UPI0030CEDC23